GRGPARACSCGPHHRSGTKVRAARAVKPLDAGDFAREEPGKERQRLADVPGAQHPAERDPEMRKKVEESGEADQSLAGPVVVAAGFVDRPAAGDLLLPEGARVEPLVTVDHGDLGVVPEPGSN